MQLPQAVGITKFDRFNAHLSTVTFAAVLSPQAQAHLQEEARRYSESRSGSELKPRYALMFQGDKMTVCRKAETEAPTEGHFVGLLVALGIEQDIGSAVNAREESPQAATQALLHRILEGSRPNQ